MAGRVTSAELFDAGLAVAVYDISDCTQTFRYRDEHMTVASFTVPQFEYGGWLCVARWEDVCRA